MKRLLCGFAATALLVGGSLATASPAAAGPCYDGASAAWARGDITFDQMWGYWDLCDAFGRE